MNWKIGILCAGDSELEPFLTHIQNGVVSEKAMLKFHEGQINGIPIVALYSGVCKVNAAIAAQILIDTYQVNAVVNAGTAGGMAETVQIFDTVISTRTAYHDVDDDILTEFHPWLPSIYFDADPALLKIAKKIARSPAFTRPVHFGKTVTGEKFIQDALRAEINEKYAPLSADMETASIAHVCYVNRIPFLAVRSITDTASHAGLDNFEQNCESASAISKDFVLELLKLLADCG